MKIFKEENDVQEQINSQMETQRDLQSELASEKDEAKKHDIQLKLNIVNAKIEQLKNKASESLNEESIRDSIKKIKDLKIKTGLKGDALQQLAYEKWGWDVAYLVTDPLSKHLFENKKLAEAYIIKNSKAGLFVDGDNSTTFVKSFAKKFSSIQDAQKWLDKNTYNGDENMWQILKESYIGNRADTSYGRGTIIKELGSNKYIVALDQNNKHVELSKNDIEILGESKQLKESWTAKEFLKVWSPKNTRFYLKDSWVDIIEVDPNGMAWYVKNGVKNAIKFSDMLQLLESKEYTLAVNEESISDSLKKIKDLKIKTGLKGDALAQAAYEKWGWDVAYLVNDPLSKHLFESKVIKENSILDKLEYSKKASGNEGKYFDWRDSDKAESYVQSLLNKGMIPKLNRSCKGQDCYIIVAESKFITESVIRASYKYSSLQKYVADKDGKDLTPWKEQAYQFKDKAEAEAVKLKMNAPSWDLFVESEQVRYPSEEYTLAVNEEDEPISFGIGSILIDNKTNKKYKIYMIKDYDVRIKDMKTGYDYLISLNDIGTNFKLNEDYKINEDTYSEYENKIANSIISLVKQLYNGKVNDAGLKTLITKSINASAMSNYLSSKRIYDLVSSKVITEGCMTKKFENMTNAEIASYIFNRPHTKFAGKMKELDEKSISKATKMLKRKLNESENLKVGDKVIKEATKEDWANLFKNYHEKAMNLAKEQIISNLRWNAKLPNIFDRKEWDNMTAGAKIAGYDKEVEQLLKSMSKDKTIFEDGEIATTTSNVANPTLPMKLKESVSTSDLQKAANAVKGLSFMLMRAPLEKVFGKGKVDSNYSVWIIKSPSGTIGITSEKNSDKGPNDILQDGYIIGSL